MSFVSFARRLASGVPLHHHPPAHRRSLVLLADGRSPTTTTTTTTTTPWAAAVATNNASFVRAVHSRRQAKRIFQNRPARERVMKRLGTHTEKSESEWTPKEPRFPPVYEPANGVLRNGWSLPMTAADEQAVRPDYPFHVERTRNKPNGAVGFLPVYSDVRNGGTNVTTIVRKVTGDRSVFLSELAIALRWSDQKMRESVRIRTGGHVELKGKHVWKINKWLVGLGF